MFQSITIVDIPVMIASVPTMLATGVLDYDIPLLLSKEIMKEANTQIDFNEEDRVYLFGKKVDIKFSSYGYYCTNTTNETSAKAEILLWFSSAPQSQLSFKMKNITQH